MNVFYSTRGLVMVATALVATAGPSVAQGGMASAGTADWSGAYVGGSLGWGELATTSDVGDDATLSISGDGVAYGLHGGYNVQNGATVYGAELAIASNSGEISVDGMGVELDYLARLVGKIGYATGDALIYGTAGVAHARIGSFGTGADDDASETGYALGAGVDYRLSARTTIGGEYTYQRFDDVDGVDGADGEASSFAVKLSYAF